MRRSRAFPLRLHSSSFTMTSDPSSAPLLLRVPSPRALPRSTFRSSSVLSDRAHLPPGPVPHRDITCAQPLAREAPSLTLRSALRLSQPLDGLLRTHARGLVSSRCHVQGSARSRASLSAQPPCLVDRSLPPCRLLRATLARLAPAATRTNLDFEASIRAKMRSLEPSYSPNSRPLPSSSFPPPGPRSRLSHQLTRQHPLLTFTASNLRLRARPRRPSPAFAQREFR
jgi:hypothetical protein